jgi:hypothetical protein
MEQLLHYVWKYKLYSSPELSTVDGRPVEVIDAGIHNTDAGPDFFNAKVRIGRTVWAGSVEIHEKASDWMRHGHHTDKAYDNVILHIVGESDVQVNRTNGEPVPQAVLSVPDSVRATIDRLVHRDVSVGCLHAIKNIPQIKVTAWLNALLSERLEEKTRRVLELLEQYEGDWNEVFYIILSRSFGFGVNNDAFEQLARSLPFHCILKQRAGVAQVEAMLFGQAGMLAEKSEHAYYRFMKQEYEFLRHKYKLEPIEASRFKSLRMRPGGFPPLRMAQLAGVLTRHDDLQALILSADNADAMKRLLTPELSTFWDRHYNLNNTSARSRKKHLGETAQNTVIINAVVPLLFAYSKKNQKQEYADKAMALLESLPAEENAVTRMFRNAGMRVENAGDSQALIRLKREYCEKKKCMYCRIGFQIFTTFARFHNQ